LSFPFCVEIFYAFHFEPNEALIVTQRLRSGLYDLILWWVWLLECGSGLNGALFVGRSWYRSNCYVLRQLCKRFATRYCYWYWLVFEQIVVEWLCKPL